MHPEILACPDCASRNIKTLATTRDRESAVGALLIGLKCCDCKTGFTVTVECHHAKQSSRLTTEDLQIIGRSAWLCN